MFSKYPDQTKFPNDY